MAKPRRTTDVKTILDWANYQLAQKEDEFFTIDYKKGVCSAVEKVLREANQYGGFVFKDINDCKLESPGYYRRAYLMIKSK